jgi:hypothetical protein
MKIKIGRHRAFVCVRESLSVCVCLCVFVRVCVFMKEIERENVKAGLAM